MNRTLIDFEKYTSRLKIVREENLLKSGDLYGIEPSIDNVIFVSFIISWINQNFYMVSITDPSV